MYSENQGTVLHSKSCCFYKCQLLAQIAIQANFRKILDNLSLGLGKQAQVKSFDILGIHEVLANFFWRVVLASQQMRVL